MTDTRLDFDNDPIAVTVSAFFEEGRGWALNLSTRRSFETWADQPAEHYDALTTSEFIDVLAAQLGRW